MSERAGALLMLAPYLIGLTILIGGPAAITLGLAMFEYDVVRAPVFAGIANFAELVGDDLFWIAIGNSLLFMAVAVPLRLIGALGLALLLRRRFRGVGLHRTAVWLPTMVPEIAYALVWLWILNPLYGPLNLALGAIGLPTPGWLSDPRAAQAGIVLLSMFTIGEGFVVALAARQQIPGEIYDQAALDGGGPVAAFRHVTLPLLAPVLVLLAARDAVFSLQATLVPALVITDGGPPPFATTYLPLFIYRNGFEYLRYGYASAATVAMFILTAALLAVQLRIIRGWRDGLA